MSNFDSHSIGIFKDDLLTVKEFVKVAINTIIFNRWIINNNYICESSAINNISYMKIKDDNLQNSIKRLLDNMSNLSKSDKNFQIDLEFYTQNQSYFWGLIQSKVYWQKWNILVQISDEGSHNKEKNMREFLAKILKELNTDKDFMPDIKLENFKDIEENKNDENKDFNFPYELNIKPCFSTEAFKNLSIDK